MVSKPNTTMTTITRPNKRMGPFIGIVSILAFCTLILFINKDIPVSQYIYPASTKSNRTRPTEYRSLHNCSNVYRKPHFMRITDASGRLGNNLFRLISLLSIAKTYCYLPVLKKQKFPLLLQTFNLSIFGDEPNELDAKQWRHLNEVNCCRYNKKVEQLNTTFNWTLNGFLQSWRYSAGKETYVRSTLQFNNEILKQANGFVHDLRTTHNISYDALFVGVHNRRGDFVNHSMGFTTPNPEYFNKSMQLFREKFSNNRLIFLVASNDIDWVRNNIQGKDVHYTNKSASVDFAILSKCNHSIISSGSYGFLAAWISGGFVVYFSGYPKPLSWLDRQFNRSDYYPLHWYPMQ